MTDTPPFANAASWSITKSINLPQLESEIQLATGTQVTSAALVGAVDATPDAPATLWLVPASLDSGEVQAAINAHTPDSSWGTAEVSSEFQDALAVLIADPSAALTDDQKDALLRGVVLRVIQGS